MLHIRWFLVLFSHPPAADSDQQLPLQHLRCHKVGLLSIGSMSADKIREKEKFQDKEYDEKLDKNDNPQSTPQHHVAESVGIEVVYPVHQTVFLAHLLDFRLLMGATCRPHYASQK